ncbi:MAG TPA: hypothetical protein VFZ01_12345 [Geminicoccaceae bacterium]
MTDTTRPAILGAAFGAAALSWLTPAPAAAVVCPSVFVPEGYVSTCLEPSDEPWRLEVKAEAPALGEITKLTARPIDEPVEDPFSWLQEQLVLDLNGFRYLLQDLLENPSSPFAGLLSPELYERWIDQLGLLGHLPLRGCSHPFQLADKDVWQIDCRWSVGPLEQLARLQLVDAATDPYLITIWTSDEKRQRHLQAIANSLEWRA